MPERVSAKKIEPVIVRTFPHDTISFTQGLLYHEGRLYESTGAPGNRVSTLRMIDTASGTVVKRYRVPQVFAEGIAIQDRSLVMLTWRSGRAMRYSLPDLKPIGSYSYRGEGWGLTSDGTAMIMSNGSDTLYFRDRSFRVVRRLTVTLDGRPLKQLNELEYARGSIYANAWFSTFVFEIDPGNGVVTRILDCTSLAAALGSIGREQVLNGVAYNPERGTFYVTGKDWPLTFEVRFPER